MRFLCYAASIDFVVDAISLRRLFARHNRKSHKRIRTIFMNDFRRARVAACPAARSRMLYTTADNRERIQKSYYVIISSQYHTFETMIILVIIRFIISRLHSRTVWTMQISHNKDMHVIISRDYWHNHI